MRSAYLQEIGTKYELFAIFLRHVAQTAGIVPLIVIGPFL